jgi:hypothetical protein
LRAVTVVRIDPATGIPVAEPASRFGLAPHDARVYRFPAP